MNTENRTLVLKFKNEVYRAAVKTVTRELMEVGTGRLMNESEANEMLYALPAWEVLARLSYLGYEYNGTEFVRADNIEDIPF